MRAAFVFLTAAAVAYSGEQPVHWDREQRAVVTLADRDESDPLEYRYVVVNSKHDYSIVVDRQDGRVWFCDEKAGNHVTYNAEGRLRLGVCVQVYGGPVLVKPR